MEKKIEEKVTLPTLEHKEDTFKIIVSELVENKIRFLCEKIWTLEWSGVLFYKVEGNFADKSLTIRCVDIYPMDIGTAGTTEFKVTPDISFYMTDHPELLEEGVYQGLIHSHNNMSTFFSGTDTDTLQSEGMDMAHFVSLIVNNAGEYTAGITRKGTCAQEVQEIVTYQSWGGKEESVEEVFEVEEEILEWFNLDVTIEKPITFETEMLERLEEIEKIKKEEKKKTPVATHFTTNTGYGSKTYYGNSGTSRYGADDGYGWNNGYNSYGEYGGYSKPVESAIKSKDKVVNLDKQSITKDTQTELPFYRPGVVDSEIPYDIVKVDPIIIDTLVRQIITSSVIIPNESTIDTVKWSKNMTSLYNKRFGTEKNFQYFAQSYIDFLVNNTVDDDALIALGGDDDALVSLTAYDVREELVKLPKNKWLDLYIKYLDDYII